MSEENISPTRRIVMLLISAIFFFGYALPGFLKEVNGLWKDHETSRRLELAKQQTEIGQQLLKESRYQEARKSFEEALGNDDQNDSAKVGLVESVSYLETPEAGLNVLADCSSDICAEERTALHSRAFDKILKEGLRPENVESLFSHGITVSSVTCTVEKMFGKAQPTLTPQERLDAGNRIKALIAQEIEKAKEEALAEAPYSFPMANSDEARAIVSQYAVIPISYALQSGLERGKALPLESSAPVCGDIEQQWSEDSRTMQMSEGIDRGLLEPGSDPLAVYSREKHRQAYHNSLSFLNDLSAASGYLAALEKRK